MTEEYLVTITIRWYTEQYPTTEQIAYYRLVDYGPDFETTGRIIASYDELNPMIDVYYDDLAPEVLPNHEGTITHQ